MNENETDMKQIVLYTITVVAIWTTQACCKQYTAGLQSSRQQSDSTLIIERLRMDTVTVPGDTITIEIPIWQSCTTKYSDTTGMLTQVKGKRSKATAKLNKDGKLSITLNCDEYRTALVTRDSLIHRLQSDRESIREVKVVEHKYIPRIFWYSMIFSCCVLVWWLAKLALWTYSKWPL